MIGFKFKGVENVIRSLSTVSKIAHEEFDRAAVECVLEIQKNAKLTLAQGGRSGKIYEFYFRRNKKTGHIYPYKRRAVPHQAAGPGEPAKQDSGALGRSITYKKLGPFRYDVGSRTRAPHGVWQELGTSNMPAHPWLRPAFNKSLKYIQDRMDAAITRTVQRSSSHGG